MIKRMIKNQIRKTGMVKELERENENLRGQVVDLEKDNVNLRGQVVDLEKDNVNLRGQVVDLEKDNQRLMTERSQMVGFSLKKNLRGVSADEGKLAVLKYILENIGKDAKILDVGFGSGVYGKLLRAFYYQNIDGVDVYDKNIHEMGLDKIYDNIFIENILDFDFEYYDLIIMGDVLEHIELESAKKLLSRFIDDNKCSKIIVSIPYEYEQGEVYGNKHEKHLQPEVTAGYMEEHYPYLKLIDSEIMAHNGGIIATYIWDGDMKS